MGIGSAFRGNGRHIGEELARTGSCYLGGQGNRLVLCTASQLTEFVIAPGPYHAVLPPGQGVVLSGHDMTQVGEIIAGSSHAGITHLLRHRFAVEGVITQLSKVVVAPGPGTAVGLDGYRVILTGGDLHYIF